MKRAKLKPEHHALCLLIIAILVLWLYSGLKKVNRSAIMTQANPPGAQMAPNAGAPAKGSENQNSPTSYTAGMRLGPGTSLMGGNLASY